LNPGDLLGSAVGPAAIAAAAALLVAFFGVRSRSRKIETINRCLHEIRRPLQVLALALPESGVPAAAGLGGRIGREPVRQAISALSSLDREINGRAVATAVSGRSELVAVRLMADACVRRWLPFARLAGAELRMVWAGPDVLVRGDGTALAAALENLIANAIEHGGSRVEVSGIAIGRKVRLVVDDSGVASRPDRLPSPAPGEIDRLAEVGGHGHGLDVVRSTVASHGGKFEAEFGPAGSRAVVVLPVSPVRRSGVSGVRVNW
jgi:signal transduction histidine kinase